MTKEERVIYTGSEYTARKGDEIMIIGLVIRWRVQNPRPVFGMGKERKMEVRHRRHDEIGRSLGDRNEVIIYLRLASSFPDKRPGIIHQTRKRGSNKRACLLSVPVEGSGLVTYCTLSCIFCTTIASINQSARR